MVKPIKTNPSSQSASQTHQVKPIKSNSSSQTQQVKPVNKYKTNRILCPKNSAPEKFFTSASTAATGTTGACFFNFARDFRGNLGLATRTLGATHWREIIINYSGLKIVLMCRCDTPWSSPIYYFFKFENSRTGSVWLVAFAARWRRKERKGT